MASELVVPSCLWNLPPGSRWRYICVPASPSQVSSFRFVFWGGWSRHRFYSIHCRSAVALSCRDKGASLLGNLWTNWRKVAWTIASHC